MSRYLLHRSALLGGALLAGVAAALALDAASPARPVPPAPPAQPTSGLTLYAAGDIAGCEWTADEQTGDLLEARAGPIAALGDTVYSDGTATEYADCYEPAWGAVKARTRPAPGNHEYHTPGATGYYGYFGAAAGDPSRGYYSYDVGTWHFVVLNSNCEVVSCAAGSPQDAWLRADLAASEAQCTLAYWHHPRFSSGWHGSHPTVASFWDALYEHGAELVLTGHEHNYERFAPQGPDAAPDPAYGIRQFVVGTGGAPLREAGATRAANSELFDSSSHGVLQLALGEGTYSWAFVPVPGSSLADSGSGTCHGAPAPPPSPVPPPPPPSNPQPPPPPTQPPAGPPPRPPAAGRKADRRPPVVRALLSRAAPGRTARLRYEVAEASRRTRERVTLYSGTTWLETITTRLGVSDPGVEYYVTWRLPRRSPRALRFCVRAWDRAGNASRRSCARLVVTGRRARRAG